MAVSLKVEERAIRPRSIRNKLRHEGKVPAIVNGYKVESTPISIDEREFSRLLRENGANTVFTIEVGGKKVNTLLRETQLDTFTHRLTHVELVSVNLSEETEAETEINLVGEAVGVKAGGTLAQTLYTVVVSATPEKLPEGIEVDISGLEIGQSISISDLPKNADYTIVTDADEQVASVQEAQELPEEGEVSEGAEPEVIGGSTEE
ncbi:50S ribosomal protein L25/general stress protein Ctc [Enterococcus hulanensis]|uniref:Large ribosomal subunit protein bL25 n=1 Tax=Enterococcus hulanensis TaxID=2559929 RepID=A0ABU3F1M5_9ENTE|nr:MULTISPECIES: 50S ribosomal protein L25/general stress protein Ctc [Enterococcus]MBO0411212.1 50S ribosomal protein L25/general stress protein Ctc [Enterococcus hulanensis]MBX8935844.1 50S ribosomal protein L25/general stress protein Ctc [Enterococcus gilvus]MDT2601039.1 50S ribosomal protein L25/general stress protein Ctc [Enterococcus hulanensis]MDT2610479.1 50S ribosomal protein L25/general stress protein Ctc [Enterococcus hulanensis]MDT2617206.1 50S ribosomal protein L25/general stress 